MSLKPGDKRGTFLTKLEERQRQMRDRITGSEELVTNNPMLGSKFKRPKEMCPICFSYHMEDVPEICWKRGLTGTVLQKFEFAKYLQQNRKGRIV